MSNGNGDISDLTLRMLRDIRAPLTRVEEKVERVDEKVTRVEERVSRVEKDLAKVDARIDVLVRTVKDNHRVVGKRMRALEIRVGARRPR